MTDFFDSEEMTECSFESEQATHQMYVFRKKEWDEQYPDATPRQRDAAINQISKECGV